MRGGSGILFLASWRIGFSIFVWIGSVLFLFLLWQCLKSFLQAVKDQGWVLSSLGIIQINVAGQDGSVLWGWTCPGCRSEGPGEREWGVHSSLSSHQSLLSRSLSKTDVKSHWPGVHSTKHSHSLSGASSLQLRAWQHSRGSSSSLRQSLHSERQSTYRQSSTSLNLKWQQRFLL